MTWAHVFWPIFTIIVVPYNTWLVVQIFRLRTDVTKMLGRVNGVEGRTNTVAVEVNELSVKLDRVAEDTAHIRGYLEGKQE